jgi:hypothetical protein
MHTLPAPTTSATAPPGRVVGLARGNADRALSTPPSSPPAIRALAYLMGHPTACRLGDRQLSRLIAAAYLQTALVGGAHRARLRLTTAGLDLRTAAEAVRLLCGGTP